MSPNEEARVFTLQVRPRLSGWPWEACKGIVSENMEDLKSIQVKMEIEYPNYEYRVHSVDE